MQRESRDSKTLSIGEFAAATQLTPKALRLYDEQGLLRPAKTTVSGYRVYALEQVSVAGSDKSIEGIDITASGRLPSGL